MSKCERFISTTLGIWYISNAKIIGSEIYCSGCFNQIPLDKMEDMDVIIFPYSKSKSGFFDRCLYHSTCQDKAISNYKQWCQENEVIPIKCEGFLFIKENIKVTRSNGIIEDNWIAAEVGISKEDDSHIIICTKKDIRKGVSFSDIINQLDIYE